MTRDRYIQLAAPEAKTRIEVVEDPVALARSAYAIWHAGASRQKLMTSTDYSEPIADMLYAEAVRLVEPQSRAFRNLPAGDLEQILSSIQHDDASGLFLSALQNSTPVDVLDGVFHHRILGYRLAPGKTLILRPESVLSDIGRHAEGTIANGGFAYHFAQSARSGIQVNIGETTLMAYRAGGGVQLNYGAIHDLLGGWADGGVQVNFGKVARLGYYAFDGIQVNHGTVEESMAGYAQGGVQVNHGFAHIFAPRYPRSLQVQYGTSKEGHDWRLQQNMRRIRPLHRKLRRRLKKFKQVLGTGDLEAIRAYDFRAFEAEVSALGKEIMERR